MGTRAILEGWDITEDRKQRIIRMMLDIVEGHVKSNTREKIRAAECLAKIDALNVAREGQDKQLGMRIQVLPPPYEQMTSQANSEMITYLQSTTLPSAEDPAPAEPSDEPA